MKKNWTSLFVLLAALCLAAPLAAAPQAVPKKPPKAVSYKVFMSILPTLQLPGFTRQKPTGSTESTAGMNFSYAEVIYEKGKDESLQAISVKIEDVASMMNYGGVDMAAMAEGMVPDHDIESENGYSKTVKVQGFKATESVEKDANTARIVLQIAKRFNVTLETTNLADAAPLNKLLANMDLKKLEQAK